MAIDITVETPLVLSKAARTVPRVGDKHISPSTVFRWIRRGLKGVRLDSVRVGHRLCTSKEALARFFTAVTEADQNASPVGNQISPLTKARTSVERARAVDQAKKNLVKMGVQIQ